MLRSGRETPNVVIPPASVPGQPARRRRRAVTAWNAQGLLGEAIAADPDRHAEAEQLLLEATERIAPPRFFRDFQHR